MKFIKIRVIPKCKRIAWITKNTVRRNSSIVRIDVGYQRIGPRNVIETINNLNHTFENIQQILNEEVYDCEIKLKVNQFLPQVRLNLSS